jgi:hypothetical protein
VTRTFAYECYADGDVFFFLRDDRRLPLQKLHSYSQGEVVNDLLVRGRAEIGMVDEDPQASHHKLRDRMRVIVSTNDLELRSEGDRHLIIVKPELEECFRRSMKRAGLPSSLPQQPTELRAMLNVPNHSKHKLFREELESLYRESKARNVQTFITELEGIVQKLLE